MSAIEILEVADGVTGNASVESGQRYTRVFQVELAAPSVDIPEILAASSATYTIPAYGEAYPTDGYAFVTNKTAEPHADNPCIWTVHVEYTVPKVNPDAPDSPDAPSGGSGGTTDPIVSQKKTWRLYAKTEAVLDDIAGATIVNSAGDPFDPAFTQEKLYPELVIERTQRTFSPQWMLDYRGKRNSAAITIGGKVWAAKCLRVVDITATQPAGQSAQSWQVTITIRYDPVFHDIRTLDVGLREKVAGKMVPIMDGGQKATQPVLLNGAGRKLAVGAAPVFLPRFEIYDTVSFTNLRLDY